MKRIKDSERRYFHVTLFENLQSIRDNGLIPRIGYFSRLAEETTASVYLFSNFDNMQNALYNWLGEQFDNYCVEIGISSDKLELLICVVDLPVNMPIEGDEDFYEVCVSAIIPPEHISFYSEDYEKIDGYVK